MAERTKNMKERIEGLSKPKTVKKYPSTLGILVVILMLPFLFMSYVAILILVIWLIQNPLGTTAMFGISIVLIGGYVTLLIPKRI